MLRRECELRCSEATQVLFGQRGHDCDDIYRTLQQQVVREFGFTEDLDWGVAILRAASALYPDDPDIRDAAFYIKYNRACVGTLQENDSVPDVQLVTLDGQRTSLLACSLEAKAAQPLVIFSGSIT
jgi:hypothetical protein